VTTLWGGNQIGRYQLSTLEEGIDYVNDETEAIGKYHDEKIRDLFKEELDRGADIDYLFKGKKLRIRCGVVSYGLASGFRPIPQKLRRCLAVTEMLHTTSLLHDDVIDKSSMRRGGKTLNDLLGDGAAVLAGDMLLADSFGYINRCITRRYIRILLADAMRTLVRGLKAEIYLRHDIYTASYGIAPARDKIINLSSRCALIAQDKTAPLIEAPFVTGAIYSHVSDETRRHLREFGFKLGYAYQLADDLLDVVGDPEETGKPLAVDLRSGNMNMVYAESLFDAPPDKGMELLVAFAQRDLSPQTVNNVLETARIYGVPRIERIIDERADGLKKKANQFTQNPVEHQFVCFLIDNLLHRKI